MTPDLKNFELGTGKLRGRMVVRHPVSSRINLPRPVALNLLKCGPSRIQFAI